MEIIFYSCQIAEFLECVQITTVNLLSITIGILLCSEVAAFQKDVFHSEILKAMK